MSPHRRMWDVTEGRGRYVSVVSLQSPVFSLQLIANLAGILRAVVVAA
jgi:hypothetical protein